VVTTEEIEQAVERLKTAGLWAQYKTIDRQMVEQHVEGVVFHGFGDEPKSDPTNPSRTIMPLKDWFSVWYKDNGAEYSAVIPLGQIFVVIKASPHFEDVITSIINYFEIKKVLPDSERMRWVSVTDPDNGLINAIFWLQRAGATTEIVSASAIHAIFPTRIYTIQFSDDDFSSIKIEGAEGNFATAQTLEGVVLNILAHQCKFLTAKVEDS
jgi:hypothetical protein